MSKRHTKNAHREEGLISVKISDTPFFRTTPYFIGPSLIIGKSELPDF